jgi:hypothetical protein
MFGCIVVAFELALLGYAFWYVFLREDKSSYKIIGDPWGNYDGVCDSTKGKVCGEIATDRGGHIVVRSTLLPDVETSETRAARSTRSQIPG